MLLKDAAFYVFWTSILPYYFSMYLPINTAHDMDEANEIIKPNHHAPTHNGESEFNIWGVGPWSKSV